MFIFFAENYIKDRQVILNVTNILKLFAFGAHRYPLTNNMWSKFELEAGEADSLDFLAYGEKINLMPLPVGTPATLAYLCLFSKTRSVRAAATAQNAPLASQTLCIRDCGWQKGAVVSPPEILLSTIFKPGSIDGVWEGMFTVRSCVSGKPFY
jgi:hypothetical protein